MGRLAEQIERLTPILDGLRTQALDERLPIADRVHAELKRMDLISACYGREIRELQTSGGA